MIYLILLTKFYLHESLIKNTSQMFMLFKTRYAVNVYEGISPSLLATMSLGVNLKAKTHYQLINQIEKSKLVQCPSILQALRQIDRQLFTNVSNPYENKPYPISGGQKMTDIFTHSLIVNAIDNHLKNQKINVLDIGCGHGYLTFLISKILNINQIYNFRIDSIDINNDAINECKRIQSLIPINNPDNKINFYEKDLHNHLRNCDQQRYDVILGGYYMDEETTQKLQNHLSENGIGVWPTKSPHGQALYKFKKGKSKEYLIQTLFSMPIMNPQVTKYFIEDGDQSRCQSGSQNNEQKNDLMDKKKQRWLQKQKQLKLTLTKLLQKYRTDGKLPNLSQMRKITQINQILNELSLKGRKK